MYLFGQFKTRMDAGADLLLNRIVTIIGVEGFGVPSLPGEAPRKQTGDYQESWKKEPAQLRSGGEKISSAVYSDLRDSDGGLRHHKLEYGTRNILPRPHTRRALAELREELRRVLIKPVASKRTRKAFGL